MILKQHPQVELFEQVLSACSSHSFLDIKGALMNVLKNIICIQGASEQEALELWETCNLWAQDQIKERFRIRATAEEVLRNQKLV